MAYGQRDLLQWLYDWRILSAFVLGYIAYEIQLNQLNFSGALIKSIGEGGLLIAIIIILTIALRRVTQVQRKVKQTGSCACMQYRFTSLEQQVEEMRQSTRKLRDIVNMIQRAGHLKEFCEKLPLKREEIDKELLDMFFEFNDQGQL